MSYQLILGLNHGVLLHFQMLKLQWLLLHFGVLLGECYYLYVVHSLQAGTHVDGVVHSDVCSGLRHAVGRDPAGHNI